MISCNYRRRIRKMVILASGPHLFPATPCNLWTERTAFHTVLYCPKQTDMVLRRRILPGKPGKTVTILHFALTILSKIEKQANGGCSGLR
jgi:hypothetical protein